MRISRMSSLLAASLTLLASSCTYNYFEGGSNYKVFVPELLEGSIADCRVLIYDNVSGALVADASATPQTVADGLGAEGLFAFQLEEGEYKVCVLTGTESVDIDPASSLDAAKFSLKPVQAPKPNSFGTTGSLSFDYIMRPYDGVTETVDTTALKFYPARIDVRYRGTETPLDAVASANISVSNTGIVQPLAVDTLTAAPEDSRAFFSYAAPEKYPADADGAVYQFTTWLFPTPENTEMSLSLTFCDASGNGINSFSCRLTDSSTGQPLRLLCGQRAVIDIYNHGITISIGGWSTDISGGNTEIEGGKHTQQ